MKTLAPSLGQPLNRVDGRLKVTGGAKYAAEYPLANVAYAVIIGSTIAKGRVVSIETGALEKMPGVLAVLTPQNAEKLPGAKPGGQQSPAQPSAGGGAARPAAPAMRVPTLLQDDAVHYNGQPIGVVVADTFEHAMAAMQAARVKYAEEKPVLDFNAAPKNPPETVKPLGGERAFKKGDVAVAMSSSDVKLDQTYTTPIENHNPMEVHNCIAQWDGDLLTLYESTQGITSVKQTLARHFGLDQGKVKVISYFTGGGFGSKGGPWSHETLAAMAARRVNRPVKLSLTRRQQFGPVGGRPLTKQRVMLGATNDGLLTAVRHESISNTSTLENWVEPATTQTRMLYASPNIETQYDLVKLNVGSPTFMRAPGESSGTFALESAMDELAYSLKLDPVALRLKNYADTDPESGKPWSSKSLRECYAVGAERFGWNRRTPEPRSMRDGR